MFLGFFGLDFTNFINLTLNINNVHMEKIGGTFVKIGFKELRDIKPAMQQAWIRSTAVPVSFFLSFPQF